MTLRNNITGDVLEVPPPNQTGDSVVKLNGEIIERVRYSDDPKYIATQSGLMFTRGDEWAAHLVRVLRERVPAAMVHRDSAKGPAHAPDGAGASNSSEPK
jgi:hypothetical protein